MILGSMLNNYLYIRIQSNLNTKLHMIYKTQHSTVIWLSPLPQAGRRTEKKDKRAYTSCGLTTLWHQNKQAVR